MLRHYYSKAVLLPSTVEVGHVTRLSGESGGVGALLNEAVVVTHALPEELLRGHHYTACYGDKHYY